MDRADPRATTATERVPSAARRAEVERRVAELREGLRQGEVRQRPSPRARLRAVAWTLALVPLLALAQPGRVGARSGPRAVVLEGTGSAGGQRLAAPGAAARVGAGDVLVAGEGARLRLQVGGAAVELAEGAQLLVERLGPPSLRLLAGSAAVEGPLRLTTPTGILVVPAGRCAGVGSGSGAGEPWADGPGVTWVDATGERALKAPPERSR